MLKQTIKAGGSKASIRSLEFDLDEALLFVCNHTENSVKMYSISDDPEITVVNLEFIGDEQIHFEGYCTNLRKAESNGLLASTKRTLRWAQ